MNDKKILQSHLEALDVHALICMIHSITNHGTVVVTITLLFFFQVPVLSVQVAEGEREEN